MSLTILGLGTAVPHYSIAQQDAAEVAKKFCCRTEEEARMLAVLYERTGIQRRGSVVLENSDGIGQRQSFFPALTGEGDRGPTTQQRMERYAEEALPLAFVATRQALDESQLIPGQIGHIITVSCTGFVAPGVDITLIKKLSLSSDLNRTHIGFMGCHGVFNGLKVASAWLKAYPEAHLLLCAVELCSLHFQYQWDPEQAVANALFADGAAALILGSTDQSPRDDWKMVANGSFIFPDSEDAMTWRVGNHGFEMTLSARVPTLIAVHLRPWLERWLARQGLTLEQIRSWAIHPGGPRILSSVGVSLGLSEEVTAASRSVLAEYGNMSSPTILFILDRLRRMKAPGPCVALGFGPGLVVEAALFIS